MAQKLRFAVVCSSNMNRSMEAHSFLQKKGYDIKSYGTGNMIKVSNDNNLKLRSCHTLMDIIFIQLAIRYLARVNESQIRIHLGQHTTTSLPTSPPKTRSSTRRMGCSTSWREIEELRCTQQRTMHIQLRITLISPVGS